MNKLILVLTLILLIGCSKEPLIRDELITLQLSEFEVLTTQLNFHYKIDCNGCNTVMENPDIDILLVTANDSLITKGSFFLNGMLGCDVSCINGYKILVGIVHRMKKGELYSFNSKLYLQDRGCSSNDYIENTYSFKY